MADSSVHRPPIMGTGASGTRHPCGSPPLPFRYARIKGEHGAMLVDFSMGDWGPLFLLDGADVLSEEEEGVV